MRKQLIVARAAYTVALAAVALAAKIWAEIHARRADDALTTAASLAESLAKASAGKPGESDLTAAGLVGTMFGYFKSANPDAAAR
jgi:hypothetical protein